MDMMNFSLNKLKKETAVEIVIDPQCRNRQYFKDLLHFRELFYFLAWRDIVVRYKDTFLGIAWAIVRPLLTLTVFALVFGKIAHLATEETPYPLFVLAAILPWTLFSGCLIDTSHSLLHNASMISKVYFPRIILPVSDIMVHFVDFLIGLALFFILFFASGQSLSASLWLLPVCIVATLLLCLGSGLWISAAAVKYRDVRFIIPFIVQFGLFLSPVGYSSFLLSEKMQWLYFLNPMAGIIEGFRAAFFGIYPPGLEYAFFFSCIVNLAIFISGFFFFRQVERLCADII